jgi:hypothetical protein
MNSRAVTLLKIGIFAAGGLLIFSSFGSPLNYGRLTIGLLALWLSAVWFKQSWQESWLANLRNRPTYEQGLFLWAINALLIILPGLILLGYGVFSPASPSLTNSGVDICQFEVGYCVSGSRAFIFIGGLALLIGLVWAYFMFTVERSASR